MSDLSRLPPQQRLIQYRERARFAIASAARRPEIRDNYLDIARSWNALADALEHELAAAGAAE
jgi:hypothetical protein